MQPFTYYSYPLAPHFPHLIIDNFVAETKFCSKRLSIYLSSLGWKNGTIL